MTVIFKLFMRFKKIGLVVDSYHIYTINKIFSASRNKHHWHNRMPELANKPFFILFCKIKSNMYNSILFVFVF